MDLIVRTHNSVEMTRNGMHCVIIGEIDDVTDEHIEKMAEWANGLWDYSKINMWKKSESMSPGYFLRDSEAGRYKVHVLDNNQKADIFGGTRKDSPQKMDNWDKKELLAYVDWFIE